MMQLTETTETLLQLLVDCDAVQSRGSLNSFELCDAIGNDGCRYQSAALAGWLEVARKAGIRPTLRIEKAPNAPHKPRSEAESA
jgi:hypothetical protein